MEELRKTGMTLPDEVPWGTHFCQFYQSRDDLLEVLAPYFRAGLESNELCVLIAVEPLGPEEARAELSKAIAGLDDYLRSGQMEILDAGRWYAASGKFDAEKVLQTWAEKEKQALARGFAGLRVSGNMSRPKKKDWKRLVDYEKEVEKIIVSHRTLAVCCYPLAQYSTGQVIETASNHRFSLVREDGAWKCLESSGRKRAEERLQKNEQELRLLADNVPALFSYVGTDGRYRFVSERYEEWFGVPRTEIVGRHLEQVLGGAAYELIRDHVEAALSGKRVRFEQAIPYARSVMRWVTADYVPDTDEQGKVKGFFALITDITERKKAEEGLKESRQALRNLTRHLHENTEKERRRIAGELHDEIGQILTALKIDFSWLMKNPSGQEERRQKTLKDIAGLLDAGMISVRRMATQLRPPLLDDLGLVPAVEWMMKGFEKRTGIKTKLETNPIAPKRLNSEVRTAVFRVVQEALTNAARHAGATRVRVVLKEGSGRITARVTDNGKGIGAKQAEGSDSVGLLGMKERVESCGGALKIAGRQGSGTTIEAVIPLKRENVQDTHR